MLVVMVVVGGTGSITGAVIAALAVSLVSEAIKPVQEAIGAYGLSQIVTALAVLLVLIFRPTGLFGHREPAVVAGATKKRAE
jgi:branched-chain amino acid transport system permease protein